MTHIVRASYQRAMVRLTASHLLQSYQKVGIPAVSIMCSAPTVYETHELAQLKFNYVCNTIKPPRFHT